MPDPNLIEVRCRIPEEIVDALKTDAHAKGVSQAKHTADVLLAGWQGGDAAEAFIAQFDKEHAELVREIARDRQMSVFDLLLAHLKLVWEQGNCGYFTGESRRAWEPTVAVPQEPATCKWCGEAFKPTRGGQQYCPAPKVAGEASCGKLARQAEVREKRERQLGGRPKAAFAPPKRTLILPNA